MSLVEGTYRAKAVTGGLGITGTDKPQIAVEFQILDEEFASETITWFGYFTDDTKGRTFESLRIMGWKGDDLSDLDGISDNEVKIVVKEEEYEGRTRLKVAWVNKPGGLALKTPMSVDQAKRFAAQMKGEAIASRGGSGAASSASRHAAQNRPASNQRSAPGLQLPPSRNAPPPESQHPDDGGDDIPF